jgi:hypothetical protein
LVFAFFIEASIKRLLPELQKMFSLFWGDILRLVDGVVVGYINS